MAAAEHSSSPRRFLSRFLAKSHILTVEHRRRQPVRVALLLDAGRQAGRAGAAHEGPPGQGILMRRARGTTKTTDRVDHGQGAPAPVGDALTATLSPANPYVPLQPTYPTDSAATLSLPARATGVTL